MKLYDRYNQRLYVNAEERRRFIAASKSAPTPIREFALTLVYTGCRISEVRALTRASLQMEARILSVRSLKKRGRHVIREVPIAPALVPELARLVKQQNTCPDDLLWHRGAYPLPRITAYRWIKTLMKEANIFGAQASPKGLRHGYGVAATLAGIQIHMLQRWMGHASISTTAIYATAIGADQLELADRIWRD